jgi:hypothetical protein
MSEMSDERRAESALRCIANGTWNVGTGRILSAREFAREALDRLRDARGDDEGGTHDAYVEPLEGGHKGYQARCWTCDWRGPEHLRRGELLGTPESRAHKNAARKEAAQHRAETAPKADENQEGGSQ